MSRRRQLQQIADDAIVSTLLRSGALYLPAETIAELVASVDNAAIERAVANLQSKIDYLKGLLK